MMTFSRTRVVRGELVGFDPVKKLLLLKDIAISYDPAAPMRWIGDPVRRHIRPGWEPRVVVETEERDGRMVATRVFAVDTEREYARREW